MPDFDAHLPDMLAQLKRLVEIESPSHDKATVDRLGARIAEECRRLGAQVEIHRQAAAGDHIEAYWSPHPSSSKGRENGLLLLCHMDTVFPIGALAKTPFCMKEDKVFGPGVLDMKGGIVVALTALAALVEAGEMPLRPVTALFTSDEEVGSLTSRALIEKLAGESTLALVLEPGMPDGALKTWRKGVGDFIVTVHGKAAHAGGDHKLGRNAIEEIAHQVLVIQKMTDYDKGTTLNVGTLHGGTAPNVVPEQAVAEVDLRVMQPGEAERVIAALHALRPVLEGTSIEVSGELNRPPMPFDEQMKATFEKAAATAAQSGIELKASGTGGASDANFIAPLGIPVLDGLGPAGEGAHSEQEFVLTASLPERARLLAALLCDW